MNKEEKEEAHEGPGSPGTAYKTPRRDILRAKGSQPNGCAGMPERLTLPLEDALVG